MNPLKLFVFIVVGLASSFAYAAYSDEELSASILYLNELSGEKSALSNPRATLELFKNRYFDSSSTGPECDRQDLKHLHGIICQMLDPKFRETFTYQDAFVSDVYVGAAYSWTINRVLRNPEPEKIRRLKPLLDSMLSVYSKFPIYLGSPVFRGTKALPADVLALYAEGRTFVADPGYLSTSSDEALVRKAYFDRGGGGWFFVIQTKTCRDVRVINQFESEILCLPGTRFHVDRRDDNLHQIWMTEIVP